MCCFVCTTLISALSNAQKPQESSSSSNPPAQTDASKDAAACPSIIPISRESDAPYLAIKGVECFEAGDYSRAYALYTRALEIQPNPALYGAIGRVLHELGIYSLAAVYYQEYLALNPSTDDSGTRMIQGRLEQIDALIEEQAGTIEVTSAPSQATVFMILPNKDWLELGPTPLQIDTQTGKYHFVVVHDGFYRQHHKVNLKHNGKSIPINAELVPENSTFDVTARQWRRTGTWTIISGAPVFLAGATLLFLGHNDISTANSYSLDSNGHTAAEKRALTNRGNKLRTWGIVTTALGTASVLTGAILYVKGSPAPASSAANTQKNPEKQPALSWTPLLGLDHVGIQLSW